MSADNSFFGTDIGTTSCSVCFFQTPHDLSFIKDNTKTDFPSVVTCSKTKEKDFLFCQGAKKHSECTLCESKRLLGMRFDDPNIQELVKNKHFDSLTLVPDKGGWVKVKFVKGGKTFFMPLEGQRNDPQAHPRADLQEVQLQRRHEDQSGHQRPGVLHALPACGDDAGGGDEGFDVVRVINEPTAAAIAELSEAASPYQRMKSLTLAGGRST